MHASPASIVMCMSNSTSESQDEDSMLMCLFNSQDDDDDGMSMCQSNSHCDAFMMGPALLKSVHASRVGVYASHVGNNICEK